jgi:hypothetical protein
MEPEYHDEINTRNTLSPDPRKDLYDEDLHVRGRMFPVKREIARNHLNKFEDFIADACDDTYSNIVKNRHNKRRGLD